MSKIEKEKRKFKRFDAFVSVRFQTREPTKVVGISLSKDLSREGIKLSSTEELVKGSLVDLEIDIPDDPKPVLTTGEVVWTRRTEGPEKNYEHGVRFVAIDPVDKFRALDYAYNNWLEAKIQDFSDPEEVPELT